MQAVATSYFLLLYPIRARKVLSAPSFYSFETFFSFTFYLFKMLDDLHLLYKHFVLDDLE